MRLFWVNPSRKKRVPAKGGVRKLRLKVKKAKGRKKASRVAKKRLAARKAKRNSRGIVKRKSASKIMKKNKEKSMAGRKRRKRKNPLRLRRRRFRRNPSKVKKAKISKKERAAINRAGAKIRKAERKRIKQVAKGFGKKRKGKKGKGKSAAAKKAAATRARKKAARVKAGKKAARTRARNAAKKGKGSKKGKGKKGKSMAKRRKRRKGPFSRYILRARSMIKKGRSKKYGWKRARKTIRAFKMRTNPGRLIAVLKSAVSTALPVAAGYVGTRLLITKVGGMIPGVGSLGSHAAPVLSAVGLFAAHFATGKVAALGKHRTGIMLGASLNLVQSLWDTYVPSSIKGMLGMGDVYEQALAADFQEDMADYVETGDYVEVGDYVEMGAEEDLAGMVGPVGKAKMLGPVPHKASVAQVPDWTPDWSQDGLYQGVFAKKMF